MMAGQSPLVGHHRCYKKQKTSVFHLVYGLHSYYSILTIHDKWKGILLLGMMFSLWILELLDNPVKVGSRAVYTLAVLPIFAVQAIRLFDDT